MGTMEPDGLVMTANLPPGGRSLRRRCAACLCPNPLGPTMTRSWPSTRATTGFRPMAETPSVAELADGVLAGERVAVARAITLVESTRSPDAAAGEQLVDALLPFTGSSVRVGITGVPGVGKSTFIDVLGSQLVEGGHRVAVLAVDPSSARSGGSILGDRTRMSRLAASADAFVRPAPTGLTLGGVAAATRESIVVVEAAGFDVVLVETVGVGQSEYVVADVVDTVVLLMLARAGDALQGLKRGILELADVVAVTKADGGHETEAAGAAEQLAAALRLLGSSDAGWTVPVRTCSALAATGIDETWAEVGAHRALLGPQGLAAKRAEQAVRWTRALVRARLLAELDEPAARARVEQAENDVRSGRLTPVQAAGGILADRSELIRWQHAAH